MVAELWVVVEKKQSCKVEDSAVIQVLWYEFLQHSLEDGIFLIPRETQVDDGLHQRADRLIEGDAAVLEEDGEDWLCLSLQLHVGPWHKAGCRLKMEGRVRDDSNGSPDLLLSTLLTMWKEEGIRRRLWENVCRKANWQ